MEDEKGKQGSDGGIYKANERREEMEMEEESFASDFYRCGSDWSCLREEEVGTKRFKKNDEPFKLKQTNLFQIWGLNKPPSSSSPQEQQLRLRSASTRKSEAAKYDGKRGADATGFGVSLSRPPPTSSPNCPFYKKIPGTPFTVDAFRHGAIPGCSSYFLTHFHSDHYAGLTKGWTHGPIYCTPLTARLLQVCLNLSPLFIHPLEMNTGHIVHGIGVTLLEANHCPGAAMIHFRLQNGQCYLHTGDFRASKSMQAYPLLANGRVNMLYLDTTYCNPKYKLSKPRLSNQFLGNRRLFPCKEEVVSYVVRVTKDHLKKQPKTLVVVGAYSIGKECVYLAISKALRVKIFANASRRRVLQSFEWPALSEGLCSNGKDTPLHILPISSLHFENLKRYLKNYLDLYTSVLAFRPTGWTFSQTSGNSLELVKPTSRGNITIYGVPYSEHSSFTELQEFVKFLRSDKIIPTVNVGSAAIRDKMQSYFREWMKSV
ncbi:DNA repair metallo-beta-lactamase [Dillenia turbinata]|uniref:DNA repair metallo-beta-lactamase n=1 Tax=Dillenia turbinata TaxID=194707 RepID=A0AAN8VEW3_9MAGN